jgi:hypothetical protein
MAGLVFTPDNPCRGEPNMPDQQPAAPNKRPRQHALTQHQDMLLSALSLSPGPHSMIALAVTLGTVGKRPTSRDIRRNAERLVKRGLAERIGDRYVRSGMPANAR